MDVTDLYLHIENALDLADSYGDVVGIERTHDANLNTFIVTNYSFGEKKFLVTIEEI